MKFEQGNQADGFPLGRQGVTDSWRQQPFHPAIRSWRAGEAFWKIALASS